MLHSEQNLVLLLLAVRNIVSNSPCKTKSNLLLYSLYYAESSNEFGGPSLRHRARTTQLHSKNVAAVASCWLHCIRLDRSEVWTSDLLLQKQMRYRSTSTTQISKMPWRKQDTEQCVQQTKAG